MAITAAKPKIEHFVTFGAGTVIGTASAAGVLLLNSSDSGDTAFVEGTAPGLARGVLAATDNDLIELSFDRLMFRAQEGEIYFEVRARFNNIASIAMNYGFNDDALDDSNTLPIELATATFTANATEFIGGVYDIDATNDDVHMAWVDDGSLTTQALANLRMTAVNPVASEFFVGGVKVTDAGSGNQAVGRIWFQTEGGKYGEKVFKSTIDRDAALTGYTGFENRAATGHNVDVQYMHVYMSAPN